MWNSNDDRCIAVEHSEYLCIYIVYSNMASSFVPFNL